MQQIIDCLKAMPECLCGVDLRSVLTNGKVEMQLKTLMGVAWVNRQRANQRSYLMDKKLYAPLDLVAFEQGQAQFWIEAKCDFAADEPSVQRSARDAMKQVVDYTQKLPTELLLCPVYIVHFLCPLPDEEQYPEWIDVFDDFAGSSEYTPERLIGDYLMYDGDQGLIDRIQGVTIHFEPVIYAVVVNFAGEQLRATCGI